MDHLNYIQIGILIIQCLLVAGVLLFLFKLRNLFGLGLLYTALGVFQYMQVFLASTIYIEIFPNIFVSPGSTVLFTGSMFAILIVYIKEDAIEARKVIYALLIANIILTLLQFTFGFNIDNTNVLNPYNLPSNLFVSNARVLLVGTLVLFADSLLVIISFEFFFRLIKLIFFRVLFTMILVLTFDTVIFSLGAFAGTDKFQEILISGILSKIGASIIYSSVIIIYLILFEKKPKIKTEKSFQDIFHFLTYRQKFEKISAEKIKQEILNKTIIENLPQGILVKNINLEFVSCNRKFLQIFSTDLLNLKHKNYNFFPENLNIKYNSLSLKSIKEKKTVESTDLIPILEDIKWINSLFAPIFNEENKIDGVVIVFEDITDKIKYREKINVLSQGIRQSPAMIIITDKNGYIEYVNPKFTEINGYSLDEIKGQKPNILKSGATNTSEYKELWKAILSGKSWKGEFSNKTKNGDIYPAIASIYPIINEFGEITNFVSIHEDMTTVYKTLKDLKKAKEKAEESDKLKSAFIENMNHEIRTPMNAIIGFSSLLQNETNIETINGYVEIIKSSGKHLLRVIDDLIDISRINTNQLKIEKEKFKISDLLKNVYEVLKKNPILNSKTDLKFILNENCQIDFIISDYNRIKQVLYNLITNSFKFTDKGIVEFGCTSRENFVEFYVKDTGIGIPETDKIIIFDRFYQVDNNRLKEGNGLGLSIVKGVVELLGGEIRLNSKLNSGTTFFFTIPII